MEIKSNYTSTPSERSKKYYSYREGGLKSAVDDSSSTWKWIEIFDSDIYENRVWRNSIIESIVTENVLLINDEAFVVNGITYGLNSGIEFLGWKFHNLTYDFSIPISQNMVLFADERITI